MIKALKKYKMMNGKPPKLFFTEDHEESCFTLDHYIDEMLEGNADEIILDGAKIVKGRGEPFYCVEVGEPAESTLECCGKNNCTSYEPRNGKNGRCKFHRCCYEGDGRKFKLTFETELKQKTIKFILTEIPAINKSINNTITK